MQFMQVLDVFIGLARGLTPAKVSEPINMLSEELRVVAQELDQKIYNLDFSNREKETRIATLNAGLHRAEQENVRSDSTNSLASQILRKAVDEGKIDPFNDFIIRDAITDFWRTSGNKIQAIQCLRSFTNLGLKEAKDQVEDWRDQAKDYNY